MADAARLSAPQASRKSAFPQPFPGLQALYFSRKRVEYGLPVSRQRLNSWRGLMTAPGTAREEHQAMEFSVSKAALLNELSTTQGVVERKTTIPILSNLLVEAKGSRLTITATDLELSIRTSCEAKVRKEGAGTIPAKKLLELVRLLPDEEIRFKLLDNHWIQITSGRRNYKLVGMAKENFPDIPAFPHPLVTIPASILSALIARTAFAISMEES